MQDIDFDEIDRAVNSVTNSGNDTSASAMNDPAIETPTAPSTRPDQAISAHAAPSLAARRSSGRFMDVVHPSSDMRPQAPATATFRREDVAPRPTEVAERPVFAPEPIVESAPEPVEANMSAAFHWPDPIDLSDNSATTPFVPPVVPVIPTPEPVLETTPEPVIEPVAPPVVVSAPAVEAKPVVNLDDELQSSLESPFLTNTKVEKRPLGAFSFSESDLPLIDDFSNEPSTTEKTSDSDTSPTELDEDILLLEADNEDEFEKVEDIEVAEPVEVSAPVAAVIAEPPATTEPTPVPAQVDDAPVGPTSITQQYKEHPATDDQSSGAIYDTATYHQPLAHPAKKGSSLLIIAWIVGLIIVGGGIGAAVYFFVLPLL